MIVSDEFPYCPADRHSPRIGRRAADRRAHRRRHFSRSGVPTFRDAESSLWARYRPEELATPEAFARDPKMVWEWYEWRRELISKAKPNPGHHALVAIEERVPDFALIT
jgi:hypothetical protein